MKIYNSLTRKKEDFSPAPNKRVNIFVCGPTVYDLSHIGHARTFLIYDAFVKFARQRLGWDINYIQNITNIDDKIIVRAQESKKDFKDVADKFEQEHYKDMTVLGIDAVDEYARATDYIPEIVSQIKRLMEKGNVYLIENDGYYFDVTTFSDYGKLSGRTSQQAEDAVTRIDESINKRNRADFAVWKFSGKDEPGWEGELGFGRPGWHIEDTAITEKHFGAQYHIHGGAIELKFPHHEAEIAQMEALSGKKPMVKVWMHAGLVDVGGEKMAKSKGNFVTIQDVLEKISPETLRMFSFSSHYRSSVDYTPNAVKEAKARQKRLLEFKERLGQASGNGSFETQKYIDSFWQELEDDFNTPEALARLFELAGKANKAIDDHNLSTKHSQRIAGFLSEVNAIFKILPSSKDSIGSVPEEVIKLAEKREQHRKNQDFKKADEARNEIEDMGYSLKDTPAGPKITKK